MAPSKPGSSPASGSTWRPAKAAERPWLKPGRRGPCFSQEKAGQHIPAQDMVALAWGDPPAGIDAVAAEAHLASCAECAAELEMATMSRRLEGEDNIALFPKAKPRPGMGAAPRSWRAAAIAAGLVAGGGAGGRVPH